MSNCEVCHRPLDKGAEGICPECLDGETSNRDNVIKWNPKWDEEAKEE